MSQPMALKAKTEEVATVMMLVEAAVASWCWWP
jgi:hypothetical protein